MTSSDSPTRIGFCITDLDPGGAEKAMVQLVTRLDRTEWEPFVWCLDGPGALVDELADANVPVTCLGAAGARDLRVVWKLYRQLRRRRPALLQTFLFHANVAGRIAGKAAGVRRIVSGIRVAEKRSVLPLWIDRTTQRLVDRHVCVSRGVADFSVSAGLQRDRILVIPNGVDVERFAGAEPADLSEFGVPTESRTVLWVGRLDVQKKPLVLLEAAQIVLDQSEAGTHFLFVGDGPLREGLEREIQTRSLTAYMHVLGWRADVANLMKAADCLVLTSAWEGMPNVILEAMAAGLPVITSDVEGVSELVKHGQTGLRAAVGSPEEIAALLQQLSADPKLAMELGRASQHFVSEEFTWDRVSKAYVDLYRQLLRG